MINCSMDRLIDWSIDWFVNSSWKLWKGHLPMTPETFSRLNVAISIFASDVTILVVEYIPESENRDACFATALFSHWVFLSSFFWMMAETFFLMRVLRGNMEVNRIIGDDYDGLRWKTGVIAWGTEVFNTHSSSDAKWHFFPEDSTKKKTIVGEKTVMRFLLCANRNTISLSVYQRIITHRLR